MVNVTPKQLDGSLLAAGTPSYRLQTGQNYAVGDTIVVIVVHDSQSIPGTIFDSLGNTYRQVAGQASHTSALGYAAYLCQVTAGGNRPILSFNLAASGMFGLRGYTGVSLATGFKGHPVAPSTVTMNDQDGSHLPYATDGDAQSVGDLVVAFIMAMNGTATFASNPMSSPGWSVVTTTQGNGISLQLLEQSPATPGTVVAAWDTTPSALIAITLGMGLPHA